jgi:hypothetical protein
MIRSLDALSSLAPAPAPEEGNNINGQHRRRLLVIILTTTATVVLLLGAWGLSFVAYGGECSN